MSSSEKTATKRSPPDARHYRDTIGLFATGVAVVIARAGNEVVGMTVNALTSVSLDPLLLLFCPARTSRFAEHMTALTGFTINLLRHEQQALSTYFAGGWKEDEPPAYRLVPSRSAPRLEGALASMDCEISSITEAGDHWIVIGKVLELHQGVPPHHPLLFFRGRYRAVDFRESSAAPDLTSVHDEPAHIYYET